MNNTICIHGHFYQPPRENPWLEAIEIQDSAYPFHDWNERITKECYAPNTVARILDKDGYILKVVNNFASISFNFGPTLLSWLQLKYPDVYIKIIAADRLSQQQYNGHGSAIAQAYNHMIMPLANHDDKFTQIYWGIEDFKFRFGREPKGMWLPETAVDLTTLDMLAEQGIQFTILSPYQARRVRPINSEDWQEVNHGSIDPSQPYIINLPSGRQITLFFYNGDIAKSVAFENILSNGENFANRFLSSLYNDDQPHLIHCATDGESYGHHSNHGDMALAYALEHIKNQGVPLTVYSAYLDEHAPQFEVEIHENTAWSCAHGVDRWQKNCGCQSGMNPRFNQRWRAPLREALDWLRDKVKPLFTEHVEKLLKNPLDARNAYIKIILNRTPENIEAFFQQHANKSLSDDEKVTLLKWLELQRHAMLMYTSCGWFFDELSGIETVQVMMYAARVVQLAYELTGLDFETEFQQHLGKAKSNLKKYGNGARIYELMIKPSKVDLLKVVSTYAMMQNFEDNNSQIYCYTIDKKFVETYTAGRLELICGHVIAVSNITLERKHAIFAVLNQADQNLLCAVTEYTDEAQFNDMHQTLKVNFEKNNFLEIVKVFELKFKSNSYTIRNLFKDDQRKIIKSILSETLKEADRAYRDIGDYHLSIIQFLHDLDIPLPNELKIATTYVLNSNFKAELTEALPSIETLSQVEDLAVELSIQLEKIELNYLLENKINELMYGLVDNKDDEAIHCLLSLLKFIKQNQYHVNLWEAQNVYNENLKAKDGELINQLGNELLIRVT